MKNPWLFRLAILLAVFVLVLIVDGALVGGASLEADEFADVIVMRLSEALELIQRGEIVDGKTALGILYAAGFKTG